MAWSRVLVGVSTPQRLDRGGTGIPGFRVLGAAVSANPADKSEAGAPAGNTEHTEVRP
jgi:hypothetical protein